jgi:hypothetical protein
MLQQKEQAWTLTFPFSWDNVGAELGSGSPRVMDCPTKRQKKRPQPGIFVPVAGGAPAEAGATGTTVHEAAVLRNIMFSS